jgi:hypothetical protein
MNAQLMSCCCSDGDGNNNNSSANEAVTVSAVAAAAASPYKSLNIAGAAADRVDKKLSANII